MTLTRSETCYSWRANTTSQTVGLISFTDWTIPAEIFVQTWFCTKSRFLAKRFCWRAPVRKLRSWGFCQRQRKKTCPPRGRSVRVYASKTRNQTSNLCWLSFRSFGRVTNFSERGESRLRGNLVLRSFPWEKMRDQREPESQTHLNHFQ